MAAFFLLTLTSQPTNGQTLDLLCTVQDAEIKVGLDLDGREPPQLNWSTAMFRKRRTKTGEQATKARRDCLEVTSG